VRIINVGTGQAHPVDRFGSRGLLAQALVRSDGVAVTVLRLAAGGEIGRHPAVTDQLFVVVEGGGSVSGSDGTWHAITAGEAAVWADGEEHATRAEQELTAVVVEMHGLCFEPRLGFVPPNAHPPQATNGTNEHV
jgi:quercetin dioxygenase-like cupin family protein